jgi:hypothetical protein
MMPPGPGAHISIAADHTNMRRGMRRLSSLVRTPFPQSAHSPALLTVRRSDVSPPPGLIPPPPGSPSNWPRPAARPMEGPTPSRLVSSLRTWPGDEPRTRCPYLDRRRPHRHAVCHARVQRPGPNRSRVEPVFRQVLCIPRPARRSDQDPLVRWRRTLSSPEEIGTRPVCVAETHDRCRTAAAGLTTLGDVLAVAAPSSYGMSSLAFGWNHDTGDVADATERVGGQS